jgi:hypothetical protein
METISAIAVICGCIAASYANAATIPAGTTITVSTVSLITSQNAVGSTFEAKIAKGGGVLKAGTKAFGKVSSSRRNPRKSEPLSVELTSVEVNGRRVSVKTNAVEPHGPPQTARQAHYGHTAGTTVVNPKTTLQFQLLQPVTL